MNAAAPRLAGPTTSAVPAALRVPLAFARRDRRIGTSYKAGYLLAVAGAISTVVIFYVLGGAIGSAAPGLDPYGAGYFAFVVLGLTVIQYVGAVIGRVGSAIREAQVTGTLELLLLSPSRLPTIVISSTLWTNVSALIAAGLFLAIGVVVGIDLAGTDLLVIAIAVPLLIVAITGIAIFAAASVIVLKRGNPIGTAATAACVVLGGVFYPITALPGPLQALSTLVPTTHALTAIRGAILGGLDVADLAPSLVALALLAIVSMAVGLSSFGAVVRFARTDGSLGQY